MQDKKGLFIAIEGIDGSGKATQCSLLRERLEQAGYDVVYYDFPQYTETSSYFIKQYLNGLYGSLEQVGPYTASLFYALDRFEAANAIREALADGKVVLANRFAGSSMAHQGSKITHPEERRGFFVWLDNLEFYILNTPRPDINIVLRVPADQAQELVDQKDSRSYTDKKRDLHEADSNHLRSTSEVYDDMCQLFPRDFARIDCVRGDQLLTIDQIQNLLWGKVEPLLPAKPEKLPVHIHMQDVAAESAHSRRADSISRPGESPRTSAPNDAIDAYFIPDNLDQSTRSVYVTGIEKLLAAHARIADGLTSFLQSRSPALGESEARKQADAIAQLVLSLATLANPPSDNFLLLKSPEHSRNAEIQRMAETYLSRHYVEAGERATLTGVWPRNELEIVPNILYEFSDQSLDDIRRDAETWSYDKKTEALDRYLASPAAKPALRKITYSWDIMSNLATLHALASQGIAQDVAWQTISPRLGYEVPELIEQAGLSDVYEECFDSSLELHSVLQKAGYESAAHYVTLLGHRVRWSAVLNAETLLGLFREASLGGAQDVPGWLVRAMHERLLEVHPRLSECFTGADTPKQAQLSSNDPLIQSPEPGAAERTAESIDR